SAVPLVNSSVCAQSPVSAGAPVGQRTTKGGNTCADTRDLSFYGHIGGLGCSARKKSKIFGTFCTKNCTQTPQFCRRLALVWPTRDQRTNEKWTTSSGHLSSDCIRWWTLLVVGKVAKKIKSRVFRVLVGRR